MMLSKSITPENTIFVCKAPKQQSWWQYSHTSGATAARQRDPPRAGTSAGMGKPSGAGHQDSTTPVLVLIELAPLSPCLSQKICCLFQGGPMSSTGGSRDHEHQPLKMIIDGFVSNT